MTAAPTSEKSARQQAWPRAGRPVVVGAPLLPQVNLLPPEIRAHRSLARLKRVLLVLVILALGLAAGMFIWASQQVRSANAELAEAEAETARLLQAQMEYAEVPQVLGALDTAEEARRLGMSTEITWAPYLTQLMTTRPENVVFEQISLTGATPMQAAGLPTNPLQQASVATLSFVGRSAAAPDAAAWIESLETIPNFVDAYVTSLEITEKDENGVPIAYYETQGSVQVLRDAYVERFVETEPADGEETEG